MSSLILHLELCIRMHILCNTPATNGNTGSKSCSCEAYTTLGLAAELHYGLFRQQCCPFGGVT
jgi:hypothetical protein